MLKFIFAILHYSINVSVIRSLLVTLVLFNVYCNRAKIIHIFLWTLSPEAKWFAQLINLLHFSESF